jgi:hypothetical protein
VTGVQTCALPICGEAAAQQQEPQSRPVVCQGSSTGVQAVQFDGIDDHLLFPISALDSWMGMTVVLVSTNTRYTFRNNDPEGGDGGVLNSLLSLGVLVDGDLAVSFALTPFQRSVQSNCFAWYRPASIRSAFSITTVVLAERENDLFVNGRCVLSTRSRNERRALENANVGWIGRGKEGSFFPGRVAEFLIYSRSLPRGERSSVETYLAAKYSLQLEWQEY